MQLHIAATKKISEIRQAFNAMFPFLKIEFFNNKSYSKTDFSARKLYPVHLKIGDIQRAVNEGTIVVKGHMKVSELEARFKEQFNLAVQVFRKSGNLWLETTMTDNWTLEQQNNHGKEISTGKVDIPEPDDYDLSRDADH